MSRSNANQKSNIITLGVPANAYEFPFLEEGARGWLAQICPKSYSIYLLQLIYKKIISGVNGLITKDQIDQVVATIVQNVHPEKIILFGSYASGNPGEDSDLDLLVVKDMPQKRIQRGREIRKYLRGIGIPIDLLVYTPQEIEEWRDTRAAFITQIIDQGRVLYG